MGARTSGLSLTLVLAAAVSLAAQSAGSAQRPVFKSTVELIRVDVVVTDKAGQPIRGLQAADFALTDKNDPQTIETFSEASFDRAETAGPTRVTFPAGAESDVADNQVLPERVVVIVLDDVHGFKGRDAQVKSIARKLVADLGPRTAIAILTTSGDDSTQVDTDQQALLRAIDKYHGRKAVRRPNQANDRQTHPAIDPEHPDAALDILAAASGNSLQDFEDNLTTLHALEQAAKFVGADDGKRKAFVWVSESMMFDIRPLVGAKRPPGAVEAAMAGGTGIVQYNLADPSAADPLTHDNVSPLSYHALAVIDALDAMRRSNVAIYAVDPRGQIDTREMMQECFPESPGMNCDPCAGNCPHQVPVLDSGLRISQQMLDLMARATGGFAVVNDDHFDAGVDRIVGDIGHYYLLGFYPTKPNAKGWHMLGVTVKNHPDAIVRFRYGYDPSGPPPPPKNPDPLVALASGVLPKSDLPLRLFALPLPSRRSPSDDGAIKTRVALSLEVTAPVARLREPDASLADEISFEVLVIDNKRSKVTTRRFEKSRWTMKAGPDAAETTVRYQLPIEVDLPKGTYQIRASAQSVKLASGGSVYTNIDIPDLTASPLTMSGLAVGPGEGSHLPVAHNAIPASADTTGTASPASLIPFDPLLDRVFTTKDALRLYFEVGRTDLASAVTAAVDMLDTSQRVTPMGTVDVAGGETVPVDLTLPLESLAPGAYALRVTVSDGAHSTVRSIGILVK